MNRSTVAIFDQHGRSPCDLVRGKYGNTKTYMCIGSRVYPPFRRMTYYDILKG
jgi:hypothetical protein